MEATKISIANANLARKINHVHLGKIKRGYRRAEHVQKPSSHSKHHGTKALANRHLVGIAAREVHVLRKALLVPQAWQ